MRFYHCSAYPFCTAAACHVAHGTQQLAVCCARLSFGEVFACCPVSCSEAPGLSLQTPARSSVPSPWQCPQTSSCLQLACPSSTPSRCAGDPARKLAPGCSGALLLLGFVLGSPLTALERSVPRGSCRLVRGAEPGSRRALWLQHSPRPVLAEPLGPASCIPEAMPVACMFLRSVGLCAVPWTIFLSLNVTIFLIRFFSHALSPSCLMQQQEAKVVSLAS